MARTPDQRERGPGELADTAAAGSDTLPSLGARAAPGGMYLERGSQLGKYVVLDRIGFGASGVVVAAFDPDLDRKIAIKVLRGHANDVARVRLVREAKALAQLNHPNVVTVHEVGTFEGEMFVAMEFAHGTLGAWLRGGRRSWREILARFVQAGHGLAAAHAANLVHRDFKPENVLGPATAASRSPTSASSAWRARPPRWTTQPRPADRSSRDRRRSP